MKIPNFSVERKKSGQAEVDEEVEDSRTQATPTKDTEIEFRLTENTYLSKSESENFEQNHLMPNEIHHSAVSMVSSQLSDDVFRADTGSLKSAPPTTDSNGNYFKFPSVNNEKKNVSDEEVEKVAFEFSLQIIHECITELQTEVNLINDLEEKARELFTSTLEISVEELASEKKELITLWTFQLRFENFQIPKF